MSDLISRQDAIDTLNREYTWHDNDDPNAFERIIRLVPSADRPTTDCTEFIKWLTEVVLDEEDWRMNPDAYGEVICRKLKKLGLLDVEDGYYVETQKTGEWTDNHNGTFTCDQCGCKHSKSNYCPNCGARMYKGGEEE